MPKSHDDVHAEIFGRINSLESKIDDTNGYLRGVVESNEKLIKLFTKALYILAGIVLFLLCVVAYGAIGDKGLRSVRENAPVVYVIPANTHDFDRWQFRLRVA